MKKIVTYSAKETREAGARLARSIMKKNPKLKAQVLALHGDLGAGKTTLLQGFARELGVKEKILSPTFILMKKFQIPNSKFLNFYHIDCYRLKNTADMKEIGFKEVIANPQNIVAIEWPERIQELLMGATTIHLTHLRENKRVLTISL